MRLLVFLAGPGLKRPVDLSPFIPCSIPSDLQSLSSLRKRMAENELSRSVNEFLSKLQDDLKEAMNTMMCSRCQGKHRYETTFIGSLWDTDGK